VVIALVKDDRFFEPYWSSPSHPCSAGKLGTDVRSYLVKPHPIFTLFLFQSGREGELSLRAFHPMMVNVTKYFFLAALTMLLYDHVLTFAEEVINFSQSILAVSLNSRPKGRDCLET
jgi:hypothetical protein